MESLTESTPVLSEPVMQWVGGIVQNTIHLGQCPRVQLSVVCVT